MYRGARTTLSKTMVCRSSSAFAQRASIRRPFAQPLQDCGWLAMEELPKAYRPGGLRPTVLGESVLDGRYKILRKLGVGKQASVWLAADTHTRDVQCVAIKIYTGDASQEEAEGVREIRALQRFAGGDPMHPGSTLAGTPLDEAFLLESINGPHLCVVTRALGPTLNVLQDAVYGGRYSEAVAQRVMHDVLQALDYCHREGQVIHTDVKLDNVASSIHNSLTINHPSLRSTKARTRKIGDGSIQITESQPVMDILRTEDMTGTRYTLIDFGKAALGKRNVYTTFGRGKISSPATRAPEVWVNAPWNAAADIWSAGVLCFQLLVKDTFYPVGLPEHAYPAILEQLFGPYPQYLKDHSDDSQFGGLHCMVEPLASQIQRARGMDRLSKEGTLFILRMLDMDPRERPTAKEMLRDPWLRDVVVERAQMKRLPIWP